MFVSGTFLFGLAVILVLVMCVAALHLAFVTIKDFIVSGKDAFLFIVADTIEYWRK